MKAGNVLLEAFGSAMPADVQASQQAGTSQGESTGFMDLVQTLIQGQQTDTQVEVTGAGQQTTDETKKQGDQPTAEAQLAACLLGSAGSVQQLPVSPAAAEQVSDPEAVPQSVTSVGQASEPEHVQQKAVLAGQTMESNPAAAETVPVKETLLSDTVVADSARPVEWKTQPQSSTTNTQEIQSTTNEAPKSEAQAVTPESRKAVADDARVTDPKQPTQPAVTATAENRPQVDPKTPTPRNADPNPVAVAATALAADRKSTQEEPGSARGERAWAALTTKSEAQKSQIAAPPEQVVAAGQTVTSVAEQINPTNALVDSLTQVQEPVDRVKPAQSTGNSSVASDRADAGLLAVGSDQAVTAKAPAAPAEPVSHLQPAREISAKVINQIVRSAKTHFFDGGAGMTLRLDPPHLGFVSMNVASTQGTVTAVLQTSSESAKQILESDIASLKAALANSGINVDAINVSVGGGADQGWNPYGKQGEQPGNGHGRPNAPWSFAAGGSSEDLPLAMTTATRGHGSHAFDYLA